MHERDTAAAPHYPSVKLPRCGTQAGAAAAKRSPFAWHRRVTWRSCSAIFLRMWLGRSLQSAICTCNSRFAAVLTSLCQHESSWCSCLALTPSLVCNAARGNPRALQLPPRFLAALLTKYDCSRGAACKQCLGAASPRSALKLLAQALRARLCPIVPVPAVPWNPIHCRGLRCSCFVILKQCLDTFDVFAVQNAARCD